MLNRSMDLSTMEILNVVPYAKWHRFQTDHFSTVLVVSAMEFEELDCRIQHQAV